MRHVYANSLSKMHSTSASIADHVEKYKKACLDVDTDMNRVVEKVMNRIDAQVDRRRTKRGMPIVNDHAFDDVRRKYEDVQNSLADCIAEREAHTQRYYGDQRDDGHEKRKVVVADAAIRLSKQRIERDCRFDGRDRFNKIDRELKRCEKPTVVCSSRELSEVTADVDDYERNVQRCTTSIKYYDELTANRDIEPIRRHMQDLERRGRLLNYAAQKADGAVNSLNIANLRSRIQTITDKRSVEPLRESDFVAFVHDATASTDAAIEALSSFKPWSNEGELNDTVEKLWDAFDKHELLQRALTRLDDGDHKAVLELANRHAVLFIRRALADVLYEFEARPDLVRNEGQRQSGQKRQKDIDTIRAERDKCQRDLDGCKHDRRRYQSERDARRRDLEKCKHQLSLQSHPITVKRRRRSSSSSQGRVVDQRTSSKRKA